MPSSYAMHFEIINLTFDLQSSKRDEWEEEALAQRMHKSVRNIKRPPQGPAKKYL
jgi:hypothetical protein